MIARLKKFFSRIEPEKSINPRLILIALALSGGAALIYEVVGSEVLYFNFSSNFHSTATVLSVFLFGMSLGSLSVSKIFYKTKNKALLFAIFQLIIAIYAIFILTNFGLVVSISKFLSGSQPFNSLFIKSVIEFFSGAIFLILPTFLCGACFPLAVSMGVKEPGETGKQVGSFYSWDMLGAVAGTIISGFFLISNFGLKITLIFAAALNLFSSMIIIPRRKWKLAIFVAGIILISIFIGLNWKNGRYLDIGSSRYFNLKDDKILFRKPSPYGLVSVTENENVKSLRINNVLACSRVKQDFSYVTSEQKISEITLQILEEKKIKSPIRILNVGLGCGSTLDYLRKSNIVDYLDVVEINPVVPEATKFFSQENNDVLEDPRVSVIIEDGFEYLRKNKQKYDAIVVDIESPLIFHSSPLYTLEFFKEASNNLKDSGVFALWAYSPNDTKRTKILFDTQQEAFLYVYPFSFEMAQLFFSSNQEILTMNKLMTEKDKESYKYLLESKGFGLNTFNNPILKTYFKK